jgi:hypothetical protein
MMLTPGSHRARLVCPECSTEVTMPIAASTRLVVDPGKSQLSLRVKAQPVEHICGSPIITESLFPVNEDGTVDADVVDAVPGQIEP